MKHEKPQKHEDFRHNLWFSWVFGSIVSLWLDDFDNCVAPHLSIDEISQLSEFHAFEVSKSSCSEKYSLQTNCLCSYTQKLLVWTGKQKCTCVASVQSLRRGTHMGFIELNEGWNWKNKQKICSSMQKHGSNFFSQLIWIQSKSPKTPKNKKQGWPKIIFIQNENILLFNSMMQYVQRNLSE